jgi:hypothetical protein
LEQEQSKRWRMNLSLALLPTCWRYTLFSHSFALSPSIFSVCFLLNSSLPFRLAVV